MHQFFRTNLLSAICFLGGNFGVGLLFSLPVKWAVAEPYDYGFLSCVAFATLFVLAGTIFHRHGSWSEIIIGTAVAGCVVLSLVGANPLMTVLFPFIFLVAATIAGLLLIASGKLKQPELW
jgi:hypothetical protein